MELLALLFGATVAVGIVAGMLHLVLGLGPPRSTIHLLFAVSAVSFGLQALAAYAMSQATNLDRYITLFKFAYGPTTTSGLLALFWFVAFCTNVRPTHFLRVVTVAFVIFALLPHLILPSGALVNVVAIRQARLAWGETITLHEGNVTLLQPIIALLSVIIDGFFAYALYRQWRRGERLAALFLALPVALFFLVTSVHGRLVDTGVVDSPYLGGVAMVAFSIPLSLKLAHDAARTKRALQESEQRLRGFVTHTQEGIWTIDFAQPLSLDLLPAEQMAHIRRYAHRISDSNDAMAQILGYGSSTELVGRDLYDVFSLSQPESKALLDVAVSAGFKVSGLVSPIRHPDGQVRYLEGGLTPILEDGRVIRVWGAARDVTNRLQMVEELRQHREELAQLVDARTAELQRANEHLSTEVAERQRAETAVRNSRRFLRSVLDSLPYQIVVLDASGNIIEVNQAWRRAADKNGLAWEGYGVGRNYLDVLDVAPDQSATGSAIRAVLAGERDSFSVEYTCTVPEGELWFVMHVTRAATEEVLTIISHVEITERLVAERTLREREALLRQTLDLLPVGVWLTDATGNIVSTNPAGLRIWGDARYVGPEEYAEYKAWWVESGERIAAEEWAAARAIAQGETSIGEMIEIEAFDGRRKFLLNSAVPLRGEQQEIIGSIIVNEDITALRQVEVALQRRVQELATLREIAGTVATLPDLLQGLPRVAEAVTNLFQVDSTHIVLSESSGGELLLLGFDRAKGPMAPAPVGLTVSETPLLRRLLTEQTPLVFTSESPAETTAQAKAFLEAHQIASFMAVPLLVAGMSVGVMSVNSAAPERAFSAGEVHLAETIAADIAVAVANLHLFGQAQEVAALEERQRIAADLHDSVTQTIYSVSIMAEGIGRLLQQQKVAEAERKAGQLRLMTLGALAEMRTLLFELRPAALADARLAALLQQLGDVFTGRKRVPVDLVVQGDRQPPVDVKLAFYRIAQEALNNVGKHAEAGRVTVTLRGSADAVEMRIADDGRGFDPEAGYDGSMGLRIMAERAEGVGARLQIESDPGAGTEIVLDWKAR